MRRVACCRRGVDCLAVPRACRFKLYALLSSLHKHISFEIVIGLDLVPSLSSWAYPDMLSRHCRFIVVDRPGSDGAEDDPRFHTELLAHPDSSMAVQATLASSTEARRRLADGNVRCDGLLPVRLLGLLTSLAVRVPVSRSVSVSAASRRLCNPTSPDLGCTQPKRG